MNIPSLDSPRTLLETAKVGRFAVKVYWDADDIKLQASGFTLLFPEKPNAPSRVLKRDTRSAAVLLDDEASRRDLEELGNRWRAGVHERIRRDWGPKAFKPDARGRWHHPFFDSSGTHFRCGHCEKEFPGETLAANLWHCPSAECSGSPMDMHPKRE